MQIDIPATIKKNTDEINEEFWKFQVGLTLCNSTGVHVGRRACVCANAWVGTCGRENACVGACEKRQDYACVQTRSWVRAFKHVQVRACVRACKRVRVRACLSVCVLVCVRVGQRACKAQTHACVQMCRSVGGLLCNTFCQCSVVIVSSYFIFGTTERLWRRKGSENESGGGDFEPISKPRTSCGIKVRED
jgi:hypothetical protein